MAADETFGPVVPGARVPVSRYRSRAFWALEWERMWTRVWLLAGHASRLAAAGDFFTFEVGPESLLVARGEDGRTRAFYNVCQHRGNLLCAETSGRATSFRCPYHAWRYRLDGSLAHAPGAETFAGAKLGADVRLAEIACEIRLGFVWVSMSPAPQPIDRFLAPVAPLIAPYGPERFALATETTVEVACNWKTSVDVNNESYHLASLHPELMQFVDDAAIREEVYGPHSGIRVPFAGTAGEGRAAKVQAERERARAEGVSLDHLPDEALVEKRQVHVFPNVQLNFTPRALEVYRHRPHGDDPLATLFDDQFYDLCPPDAPPRPPKTRRLKHGEAPLGPVMGADVDLLPRLTRGMASRGFEGLYLGGREGCIAHMHRALDGYLFGQGAAGAEP